MFYGFSLLLCSQSGGARLSVMEVDKMEAGREEGGLLWGEFSLGWRGPWACWGCFSGGEIPGGESRDVTSFCHVGGRGISQTSVRRTRRHGGSKVSASGCLKQAFHDIYSSPLIPIHIKTRKNVWQVTLLYTRHTPRGSQHQLVVFLPHTSQLSAAATLWC